MNKFIAMSLTLSILGCSPRFSMAQESKPFFEQFKPTVGLVEKIEKWDQGKNPILVPLGTAFWVGSRNQGIFLISNKHVFSKRDRIALRVYQAGGGSSVLFLIELNNAKGIAKWIGHPDSRVDIAAIKLNPDSIQIINDVNPKITTIPFSLFAKSSDVVEGDDVFFIGFPLGLRTTENSFPLLRAGTVSLLPTEDFLVSANQDTLGRHIVLLDAMSVGGSSGSPVFLKPGVNRPFLQENVITAGTESKFIGILSGHLIDFQPVATPFGEGVVKGNAALAIVHPASQILETINLLTK